MTVGRPTKSHVEHAKKLADGRIGCHTALCPEAATWWEDWEHNGVKRFVSTAQCDEHRTGPDFPKGKGLTERPVQQPVPHKQAAQ